MIEHKPRRGEEAAAMSERIIADSFDRWLREQGLVFRRDRMDKATTCVKGWPDFEIIQNGRVLLIELKTLKGSLSRDQRALHKRFKQTGTTVYVCRDIETAVCVVQLWRSLPEQRSQESRENDNLRRYGLSVYLVEGDQMHFVRKATPEDSHIPFLT